MSAPLYFFPALRLADLLGQDALNRAVLDRYGLADILGDVPVGKLSRQEMTTAAGPGSKSGSLITTNTAGQPPVRFGYHAEFQEWIKVLAEPELWVGVDKEHRPTPEDLARPNMLDGYPVTLADGNAYQVPIIRSVELSRGSLPREMYYGPTGEFQMEIHRDYKALWERSAEIWDFMVPDDSQEPDDSKSMLFSTILDHCLAVLGVNYRYGRHEQAALRLIHTGKDTWEKVFEACIDGPFLATVVAAAKKNEDPPPPATASTSPGPEDSGPNTGPAEANST